MFLTYMDFILFLLALFFRRKLVEHQEMMNIKNIADWNYTFTGSCCDIDQSAL